MTKKRVTIVAIVLFLLLGLTIFTFANPNNEDEKLDGNKTNDSQIRKEEIGDESTPDDEGKNQEQLVGATDNVAALDTIKQLVQAANNATDDNDDSYIKALAAVITAENKVDAASYNAAKKLVDKLANGTDKDGLNDRLKEVKNGIDVTAIVEKLEKMVKESKSKDDMDSSRDYRTESNVVALVNNLKLKVTKENLSSKLNELAKLLDDTTAPKLNIENNSIFAEDATIIAEDEANNNFKIFISKGNEEQNEIENNSVITEDGIYTLTVEDEAFNEQTITFTIDKTLPKFNIKSGSHSTGDIAIVVDDLTLDYIEIYNQDKKETTKTEENNFTLTEEATYRLTAYDKAGHKTTIYVAIDKTNPSITLEGTVGTKKYYRSDVKVTAEDKFLTEVKVNGEVQTPIETTGTNNEGKTLTKTFTEEGTYKVVAKDKVGNTKEETFIIDKTAPVISNVENNKYYNTDVTPAVSDQYFKNATLKLNGTHIKSYKVGDTLTEEGTYTLVATDLAMNKSATITFTIDKTAPKFSAKNGSHSNGDMNISVDEDAFDYVEIYNQDKKETTKTEENNFTLTEEATYRLTAYDKAGNKTTIYVAIDKTNPSITLEGTVGTEKYYRSDVKVTVEDKFLTEVKVNGEVQTPIETTGTNNEGKTLTKTFTEEGTYKVVAKDKVGNTKEETFIIDKTAPTRVYSTLRFKEENYKEIDKTKYYFIKNGESFEFAMSFSELLSKTPTVEIAGRKIEMKLNEKVLNNESKYLYEGKFEIPADEEDLTEGVLEIKVSDVADLAGNTNDNTIITNQTKTSNSRSALYDRTAPTITIVNTSIGLQDVYSKLNLKLYDLNEVAKVVINGTLLPHKGKWVDINDTHAYTFKNGINKVEVTDRAGNVVTKEFNVDKVLPSVTDVKQVYETKENGRIKLTVTFSENVVYPFDSLNWRKVNDTEYFTYFYRTKDYTINFQDIAGNKATHTLNVDMTAPTATISLSPDGVTREDVTVTLTASEAIKDIEGWTKVNDTTFTKVYTDNKKEYVDIYDLIGNPGKVFVEVKRIDRINPTFINLENNQEFNTDVTYEVTKGDTTSKTFAIKEESVKTIIIDGLSYSEKEAPKTITTDGRHTIKVIDKAGNESEEMTFIIDKTAPETAGVNIIGRGGYAEWKNDSTSRQYIMYVANDGIIDVYAFYKEALATLPSLKINGKEIGKFTSSYGVQSNGNYKYGISYKVKEDDGLTDGLINIEVYGAADKLGNVSETMTEEDANLASQKNVYIDRTAPATAGVNIVGGNYSEWITTNNTREYIMYAKTDSTIYVYAFYKESLVTLPSLKINGKEIGKFTSSYGVQTDGMYKYGISYKLTENDGLSDGRIHIEVYGAKDKLGNISETMTEEDAKLASQKNITIDRTKATATISLSKTEITNEDIIATLTASERIKTPEGWTKVNDTTFTKRYSNNKEEVVTITDLVGNTNTVNVKVNNIDKISPTATVKYSASASTVTATLTASEKIETPAGWAKVNDTTFTKEYNKTTTETVNFTDFAGNSGSVNISVTIATDTVAPTATFTKVNGEENNTYLVTMVASEKIETPSGWTKVNDTTFTKTFQGKGKQQVTITDLSGNTNTVSFKIKDLTETN